MTNPCNKSEKSIYQFWHINPTRYRNPCNNKSNLNKIQQEQKRIEILTRQWSNLGQKKIQHVKRLHIYKLYCVRCYLWLSILSGSKKYKLLVVLTRFLKYHHDLSSRSQLLIEAFEILNIYFASTFGTSPFQALTTKSQQDRQLLR